MAVAKPVANTLQARFLQNADQLNQTTTMKLLQIARFEQIAELKSMDQSLHHGEARVG